MATSIVWSRETSVGREPNMALFVAFYLLTGFLGMGWNYSQRMNWYKDGLERDFEKGEFYSLLEKNFQTETLERKKEFTLESIAFSLLGPVSLFLLHRPWWKNGWLFPGSSVEDTRVNP